ncbi:MAG: response regulator [Planctomycetota bacterium]|nr:response regulator [Planctomycetota bacterium]
MSAHKKILVVDDDPDITDQLTVMLKKEGYEVVVAGGQTEAEEALISGKPDLAVVDLMMETQDAGLILCHEIRRLYPELPVIILTSVKAATGLSFTPSSPDEQSWVQANCVLDKPVRPERLKAEIARLLTQVAAKPQA